MGTTANQVKGIDIIVTTTKNFPMRERHQDPSEKDNWAASAFRPLHCSSQALFFKL